MRFGQRQQSAGDYAEDLAASMLDGHALATRVGEIRAVGLGATGIDLDAPEPPP